MPTQNHVYDEPARKSSGVLQTPATEKTLEIPLTISALNEATFNYIGTRTDRYMSRYYDTQHSHRYLVVLNDGRAVEATAYYHSRNGHLQDLSIDVSTMLGCPVGCSFCESGSIARVRVLSVKEIICQFDELVRRYDNPDVPHVVCSFQGIGEPSLIPNHVIAVAERVISTEPRFAISISTTGVGLTAFQHWRESGISVENLQISLGAPREEMRRRIINAAPPITELICEARRCLESGNFRKVKFNLVLISHLNDSDEDIDALVSLFRKTDITVKLSALNSTNIAQRHGLSSSSLKRAEEMAEELRYHGIDSYVFGAFNDIEVSCGQLVLPEAGNGN